MQELMLISNPRRRRKGGRKARKARRAKRRASPAQIAARKRFAAMARAGSFKRRRRGRKARRAARSITVGVNPMRKRRRSRARRRNPSGLSFRSAVRQPVRFIMPALWGAVGAIAVNTIMSRVVPLVLPANLQAMFMVGRARYLTQAIAAVGLGMAAQRFGVRAGLAERMAEGSLTVTMTDALRDLTLSMGVPLGGVGYYLPGRNPGAAVPSASGRPATSLNGMGMYASGPGASASVIPMRRGGLGFGPGRTF